MAQSKFVLYADDDADDKAWVREAAEAVLPELQLVFVPNGRQLLDYLQNHALRPALIVLDLNMPELDGRQTLKRLKAHPAFKDIPVVIVTTSDNPLDRQVCRLLGAELFLTKPNTHQQWQEVISHLANFIEAPRQ